VTLCFFYCKSEDAQHNTFAAVAKAILLQLLQQNEFLLPYFWEKRLERKGSGITLNTISVVKELLEISLKSCGTVYLIIDGLDECPRDERKEIATEFKSIVNSTFNSESNEIRCMFVSQDDGFSRKDFMGLHTLRITTEDNKGDITNYSKDWISRIEGKFGLTAEEGNEILNLVMRHSEGTFQAYCCHVLLLTLETGIFLFAQLVLDNLFEQINLRDLKDEINPDKFPHDLGGVYVCIIFYVNN
jgi:hypothetical protein